MKKVLLGFIAVALMCSISCEKDRLDSPGNIQGMGNTQGDLKVKEPFFLPQGVYIVGDITGLEGQSPKSGGTKLTYDVKSGYSSFGSGKMVRLKLTLLNTSDKPKTVFFHKGLLWQCKVIHFQHAMCLQTTWACLQPKSQRTIYMDLYCINYGIPGPDNTASYKIIGVSDSKVIGNLLTKIGWRKINYEMIYGTWGGSKSATEDGPTYDEITDNMQRIVWNLTNNGKDISAEDIDFIESIPELAGYEIPQVDDQSQFPEYFDEFVVPGK